MRLTCFKGPSVYSWQILDEVNSEHYLPKQWNRLRVRVESDRFQCFVNGHLVIESNDKQLTSGKLGLVKFRDTNPDFKKFSCGKDLAAEPPSKDTALFLADLFDQPENLLKVDSARIKQLGQSSDLVSREFERQALELENRAELLRKLAGDVKLAPTLQELRDLMANDAATESRLLRGALLIARLDNPDIDVDAYCSRIDQMAGEVRQVIAPDADATARRDALHKYLFIENGFHGGRAEYYHPANSHLSRVIDDREGLPITLSILYMELGRRLDLKMEGVGLPGHFVVKHVIEGEPDQLIDVFERGNLLSAADAERIVATYARRDLREADTRGQSVSEILTRVVNNLFGIANESQDIESMHRYCEALVAIDPSSAESRMMRSQVRAMSNRTTGAIEDLDWLLENDPPGLRRTQTQQLRDALFQQQQSRSE